MRKISGIGQERGIHVLDAPISGGIVGARDATLTISVGGLEEDLERVRPMLQTIGRKIVYMGPAGSGNAIKLTVTVHGQYDFVCCCVQQRLDRFRVVDARWAGQRLVTDNQDWSVESFQLPLKPA